MKRTRRSWRGAWLDRVSSVLADVRYGTRLLVRSPGFSLTVVVVLGLGITANMVTCGLMAALTVRPLAGVADAGRLQFIGAPAVGQRSDRPHLVSGLSVPARQQPVAARRSPQTAAATWSGCGRNCYPGTTSMYWAFEPARPRIAAGRCDAPGQHPVAVLGAGYWRRMYGAAPDIVGRSLRVNGRVFTIVGVASDLYVPLVMGPALSGIGDLDNPDERWLMAFGFPKPGVTLAHAQAEAAVLSARLAVERRDEGDGRRAVVVPISQRPYGAQAYLRPGVNVLGAMSVPPDVRRMRECDGARAGARARAARRNRDAGRARGYPRSGPPPPADRKPAPRCPRGRHRRGAAAPRRTAPRERHGQHAASDVLQLRWPLSGVGLGVLASLGGASIMSSVLYGVSAVDVVSFSAAALVLLVVVVGASIVPAWRAASASPVTALRQG